MRKVKVCVVDDFSATALRGLTCEGKIPIDSVEDAERYLLSRAGDGFGLLVRIIHTFEEFTAENGMQVSIGCGLRLDHLNRALQFLNTQSPRVTQEANSLTELHQECLSNLQSDTRDSVAEEGPISKIRKTLQVRICRAGDEEYGQENIKMTVSSSRRIFGCFK